MNETSFVESNALLAVIRGDSEEALQLVRDMLPGERARLADSLDDLSALIRLADRTRS